MSQEPDNDYLWDGSGVADPEVARLEEVLGQLRHRGTLPELAERGTPVRPQESRGRRRILQALPAFAAAAVLLVVAGVAWITLVQPRLGWAVESVAGTPAIDGRLVEGSGRLGVGRWLTTDQGSRARIAVGHIGEVDVEPNTRVQLLESRAREHRLSLVSGTIHARIWAPPKFFFVNTPSAVAIDLGCAYTLQVHPDGSGIVRVTHGWVGFEHGGREAFIPAGAVCATRPGPGPGTPHYEDAPAAYPEALAILDFGGAGHPGRSASLDAVLAGARRRDALTLWHLVQRGSRDERVRVYDRMAAVAPPPAGITRNAVLEGDRRALDLWWNSLGLDTATWWRIWKKNW